MANECVLGVGLADNAGTEALTDGYGHFKEKASNIEPGYQPKSVNTDGWEHTQRAWKDLFPGIAVILCFLHAFLNIRDRCKHHKELLRSISERAWDIYHAETVVQFSQRIRRLRQWPALSRLIKKAFSHPQAYRTSNALDLLINYVWEDLRVKTDRANPLFQRGCQKEG